MLVITRKAAESFIIGEDIKVVLLEITGDKAKIGIDAPQSIKILRSEVADTITNNREAVIAKAPENIELLKNRIKNK